MSELQFPSSEELHQFHVSLEYRLSEPGTELDVVEEELADVFESMFEE